MPRPVMLALVAASLLSLALALPIGEQPLTGDAPAVTGQLGIRLAPPRHLFPHQGTNSDPVCPVDAPLVPALRSLALVIPGTQINVWRGSRRHRR